MNLLKRLKADGHNLILWTNSVKFRTHDILKEHKLRNYFSRIITREDYDTEGADGIKNIKKIKGDVLIDDNPAQQRFAKKYGYHVFVVKSFLTSKKPLPGEFDNLYHKIDKLNRGGLLALIRKLFS